MKVQELHQQPRGAASSERRPVAFAAWQLGQKAERCILCLVSKLDFTQRDMKRRKQARGLLQFQAAAVGFVWLCLCLNHWLNTAHINFFPFIVCLMYQSLTVLLG